METLIESVEGNPVITEDTPSCADILKFANTSATTNTYSFN